MNRYQNGSGKLKATLTSLITIGGILILAVIPSSIKAQEKPKPEANDQKKTDAKPTSKDEKKDESKQTSPVQPQANPDDPAKLKEQITGLQKEVTALKPKAVTPQIEKT